MDLKDPEVKHEKIAAKIEQTIISDFFFINPCVEWKSISEKYEYSTNI